MAAVLSLQVAQHPASVDAYIRHGWHLVPIPFGRKGPIAEAWNNGKTPIRSQADLPPGWGIGLGHAFSGTMALDVDDAEAATIELRHHGIDLAALLAAPDAVTIESGNPGHCKLLYAMPFPMTSRQIKTDGKVAFEFRCATASGLTVQDVLPPSIHPTTLQSYRWGGAGNWQHLPLLPTPLLMLWHSLLTEPAPATSPPDPTVNWDEVRAAVGTLDPDCSREDWIQVGMALHLADGGGERGLQVWDEWSATAKSKYPGRRQIVQQWRSFRDDKGSKVTLGTLFHLAREAGWQKPAPDVAGMFKPVEVTPSDFKAAVRSPAPKMNFDLWPAVLRDRALKLAQATSCDPLVPLWAGLAAAAGAADARSRIRLMDGWEMPPVLWLCTIGDPAQRKTPGSNPMRQPLQDIEAEDRPHFAQRMLDWEMKNAIWAADHKEALDWAKSEDRKLGGQQPTMSTEPEKPAPLRLVVGDVTSQKLVRIAATMPQGLVCWLDEMNSWCNRLTDPRSGEQRSTWTEAYDSKHYTLDRVGDGTITATNFAVSIYGNIQPTIFQEHIRSLAKDGFIQRFIPCILGTKMRSLNAPMADELSGRLEFDAAIRCIHALPPLTYTLTPGAFAAFREFQQWHIQRTYDDMLLARGNTYLTAMGKLDGTVGRLALIMHLLETPFATVVSEDLLRRAIEVAKTYLVPALRYVFGEMAGESSVDAWVADYIVQYADRGNVTLSEIKRSGRRQFDIFPNVWAQDQAVFAAMVPLEDAGWVLRTDDGTGEQRHYAQWAINPAILTQFTGYRSELIAARQRDLDYIYRLNPGERRMAHGYAPQ